MPTIKEVLRAPIALPRSIEASLPKGVPQISAMMESVTNSLPALPNSPIALPTVIPQVPKMARVTEFIKGIEATLPAGLPKVGQAIPGAETPPAPVKAPRLVFE